MNKNNEFEKFFKANYFLDGLTLNKLMFKSNQLYVKIEDFAEINQFIDWCCNNRFISFEKVDEFKDLSHEIYDMDTNVHFIYDESFGLRCVVLTDYDYQECFKTITTYQNFIKGDISYYGYNTHN